MRAPVVLLAAATAAVLAGCAPAEGPSTSSADPAACPGEVVEVVVSVAQWGDVVRGLGGPCAAVTTVLASPAVDPHDHEATAGDIAAFSRADVVVVNGADYDHWALDAVDALATRPPVVDAAEVTGTPDGADPHLWYDPAAVREVGAAVTRALAAASPAATPAFTEAATAWSAALQPYLDEVATLRAAAAGRTYAATEGVFDRMAAAIGLTDATPPGYHSAAGNESEPAPGDIAAFERALQGRAVDVLVVNTQTEGTLPAALRSTAEAAGVPVVEVTESPPTAGGSFVAWQLDQLRALSAALGAAA